MQRTAFGMQEEDVGRQGNGAAIKLLTLLPELEYNADDIAVSSSGSFAAVCGSHRNVSLIQLGLPLAGRCCTIMKGIRLCLIQRT